MLQQRMQDYFKVSDLDEKFGNLKITTVPSPILEKGGPKETAKKSFFKVF
jgi:hypothetical protein